MSLALVLPVFSNLLGGLVQPVFVRREPDNFDSGKPFRRIGSRIAERCQLTHPHQNLNVMLREAEELGCLRYIQPRRQISRRPACRRRLHHKLLSGEHRRSQPCKLRRHHSGLATAVEERQEADRPGSDTGTETN